MTSEGLENISRERFADVNGCKRIFIQVLNIMVILTILSKSFGTPEDGAAFLTMAVNCKQQIPHFGETFQIKAELYTLITSWLFYL